MPALSKPMIDGLAGGGLALALALVVLFDRAAPPTPSGPSDLPVVMITDPNQRGSDQKKLRLALTPTFIEKLPNGEQLPWDNKGKLLLELGEGYRYDEIQPATIAADPRTLDPYDVLFFTCAPDGRELKHALLQFVSRGGTLYASDWRYDAVAEAFPEVVDRKSAGAGTKQLVEAEVVDPGLRELFGSTIPLRFDLPKWKIAAFAGPRVTTLLRGNFRKQMHPYDDTGTADSAPLLVKFSYGKGTVIFTSFHNERANSDIEKKLLQHLVFQLVTAGVDAEVNLANAEAGFAPTKSNLLSTPKDNPSVTRVYNNPKVAALRVALAFRNEGARMRLNLKSPDGKQFHWEGEGTMILEILSAAAGDWTYTVTALRLPYENFPFTVNFGEKK